MLNCTFGSLWYESAAPPLRYDFGVEPVVQRHYGIFYMLQPGAELGVLLGAELHQTAIGLLHQVASGALAVTFSFGGNHYLKKFINEIVILVLGYGAGELGRSNGSALLRLRRDEVSYGAGGSIGLLLRLGIYIE